MSEPSMFEPDPRQDRRDPDEAPAPVTPVNPYAQTPDGKRRLLGRGKSPEKPTLPGPMPPPAQPMTRRDARALRETGHIPVAPAERSPVTRSQPQAPPSRSQDPYGPASGPFSLPITVPGAGADRAARPEVDPFAPPTAQQPPVAARVKPAVAPGSSDPVTREQPIVRRAAPPTRSEPALDRRFGDREADERAARMGEELAAQRAALEAARRPRQNRNRPDRRPSAELARRRPGPILAALAVVLIGFGVVVLGGLRATTLAPPPSVTAKLSNSSQVPVITSAVGLLGLDGPRARITVRAAAATDTVFLGIGRASDVEAYLGEGSRLEMVGRNEQNQLLTRRHGDRARLTDPDDADVWAVKVRVKGAATLAWPQTEGQWVVVTASDGTKPAPADVTITWSGREAETVAPVLIAVGVLLMVAGGVTLVMLSSRSQLDRADGPGAAGYGAGRTGGRDGARL
ncbi:hypothetical protein ACIB24_21260 [Spongisporangium articulatum]|uniref:Uncharacterized protein n=1 Tax=Spongisporangium articulatum TaxID=3362603 RepID=A0ABW8AT79_9ACTN